MNTSKNLIIGAIVLLAVIGIGWLLIKDDSTVDNPTPSVSTTVSVAPTATPRPTVTPSKSPKPTATIHRVLLDAQGLNPASVTVRSGDAVSFVNNTNAPFWPVAESGKCPTLNAGRALYRGEGYTAIFTTPGVCVYHNQSDPANQTERGTIIVQ